MTDLEETVILGLVLPLNVLHFGLYGSSVSEVNVKAVPQHDKQALTGVCRIAVPIHTLGTKKRLGGQRQAPAAYFREESRYPKCRMLGVP